MRRGKVLKLAVAGIPADVSEKRLRAALERYGTVKSLERRGGSAEAELVCDDSKLIDSTGIGEVRIGDRSLSVRLIPG